MPDGAYNISDGNGARPANREPAAAAMTDEHCIICGETEDGSPDAEAAHFQSPTHVHEFLPPSKAIGVLDEKIRSAAEEISREHNATFDASLSADYIAEIIKKHLKGVE